MMEKKRLGFAMTGSFCTWSSVIPQMEKLTEFYEIYPIFSISSSTLSQCAVNEAVADTERTWGRRLLIGSNG